jgi:hypothetical protein
VELPQLLALVAFVATAGAVTLGVRATGGMLARTRQAEGFRGDVGDLARRIETSLGDVAMLVDDVRRRASAADGILENVDLAMDAVARYEAEVHALGGPPDAAPHRDAMAWELQRAARALELIEHGCRMATSGRREERGPEADTSIKRGYLNLIHAREAIADHAVAAEAAAEAASPIRRFQHRGP